MQHSGCQYTQRCGEMPGCVEAAHLSQHSGAPQVGFDLQNDPTLQESAARTLSMLLLVYSCMMELQSKEWDIVIWLGHDHESLTSHMTLICSILRVHSSDGNHIDQLEAAHCILMMLIADP